MKFPPAKYECTKCGHNFEREKPGVHLDPDNPPECDRCGSVYVKWLNYKDFTR